MLSIKDINEVSFRKSNFSGYNSDDVDQFIDEVLETVTALAKENADAKARTADTSAKIAELTAKNAELQEKLSILAEKIESYRADEDGIKEAILSAQRLGNASVREAKAKAETIVADANAKAESILTEARAKSQNLVDSYKSQIAEKEKELEAMKREVTSFRASLYEIYREHIAVIEKIPEFAAEEPEEEEKPAAAPAPVKPEPVKEEPKPAVEPEEEVIPVPAAAQREEKAEEVIVPVPAKPVQPAVKEPASVYDKDAYIKEQFNGIGLDLNAYSDIPETLQKEKDSLFSTLEFGIEDTSKKKGKFKRR
ncbi:MAG: DivIVA domain-containing protein [Hominenteromicrobium sp.]